MNNYCIHRLILTFALFLLLFSGCGGSSASLLVSPMQVADVVEYQPEIINQYPHDTSAFTQGLFYHNGFIYESTGQYGSSSLRRITLETGVTQQQFSLQNNYFAEGAALVGNHILQLTWQSGTGFVYDSATMAFITTFSYTGQGWGLTADDNFIYMSDGTATIRKLDPVTFQKTGEITVHDNQGNITLLNELEFIGDELWANIWKSNEIIRIDVTSGTVTGRTNLTVLRPSSTLSDADAVLNGIAWDKTTNRIFVTGKRWPILYEIQLKRN
jgi:glutaminyl-peptide cyclotransferase